MESDSDTEAFQDAVAEFPAQHIATNMVDNVTDSTARDGHRDNTSSEFDILKEQDSDSGECETFTDEEDSSHTEVSPKVQEMKATSSNFTKDMEELSKKLIGIDTVNSGDKTDSAELNANEPNCDKDMKSSDSLDRGTPDTGCTVPPQVDISKDSQNEGATNYGGIGDINEELLKDTNTENPSDEANNDANVVIEEDLMREEEAKMSEEEKEARKEEAQELKAEGNTKFKEKDFQGAIQIYSQALLTCPICYAKERSIMYSNRAACRFKLEDYELSSKDCSKALDLNPNYLKALLRRAESYEKMEKLEEALEDYQKALTMDPTLVNARQACMRLPDQINERNEKMKAEMMGKLKDLGNMVLRPFGLSTNNFQLQQDPNTGSYSVNFQQNPPKNGPES